MLATPGAVLVGRRLPRVSLARARAAGTLLEIRAAELAFDARECAELLQARLGREPGRREIERVLELTEGWPFGVALAAAGGPLGRIRLDAQDAVAFLDEEILDALPAPLHDALLDAAVPDRLDAAMAHAVGLEEGALHDLAARDLFLRRCDADGHVHRFHPLFRAAVRARAARVRTFAHRARLHGAVAEALAAEGRRAEATEHWLEAGDWRSGLAAVIATGPALMGLGAERLERWLQVLEPEARDAVGGWLLEGAHACASGLPERAVEPLSSAVALAQEARDEAGEWAARALLASALRALGEPDHARDAAEGFESPSGWRAGPAAPAAALSAALALAAAGRDAESRTLAAAALRHPAGASFTALEHLRHAQLDLPRGRLDAVLSRVRGALAALPAGTPRTCWRASRRRWASRATTPRPSMPGRRRRSPPRSAVTGAWSPPPAPGARCCTPAPGAPRTPSSSSGAWRTPPRAAAAPSTMPRSPSSPMPAASRASRSPRRSARWRRPPPARSPSACRSPRRSPRWSPTPARPPWPATSSTRPWPTPRPCFPARPARGPARGCSSSAPG